MKYQNLATSRNPALIIFLIDVSRSMEHKMPNGKRRIDVVRDVMFHTIQEMVHRSTYGGKVKSRYRVGLLAYSEDMWDVWSGLKTIDQIENEIPDLPLQTATDMAMAFRGVTQIIEQDIQAWNETWKERCPAPMVIHITDAEVTEEFENPTTAAKKLMNLTVADGNLLLANIFISEYIKLPDMDVSQWPGYYPEDTTHDRFGDMLLAMTSPIPEPYLEAIVKEGMSLKSGARMLFPGANTAFIKAGFAMSGLSSRVSKPVTRAVVPEPKMNR